MKKGFTLVEMLVSIVILSFVVGISAYSFGLFVDIVKKNVAPYPYGAVKFSYLDDVISSMFYFVAEKNVYGKESFFLYFYGDSREMEFISAEPIDIKNNIALCKIYVKNQDLVLEESPVYSPFNDYKMPYLSSVDNKTLILFKNVSGFRITYFYDGIKRTSLHNAIPSLIKMDIVFNGKGVTFYFKIQSNFRDKLETTRFLYAPF